MYQMDEVSDSSNTSSASAASVMGARFAPPVQLRRLSQQDAAGGSGSFDDSTLTVGSVDAGHALPIQPVNNNPTNNNPTNNNDGTTVLQAATPGATEPRMAGDGMSSLGAIGAARDLTMTGTITDSSASHLGDMLQSNPVAAPNLDTSAPQQAFTSNTLDAANNALEAPAPGPWSDAGSDADQNGAPSRSTGLNGDAGFAGASDSSQHADGRTSPVLDVLPLDNLVDQAPHHNTPANDDTQPAQSSGHRADALLNAVPILNSLNSTTSGHADVPDAGAAHSDAATVHTGPLNVDSVPEPANDAGLVNANHNQAASSGASGLASDDAAGFQTQATPPSSGALVEAGTKAILLATDEAPNPIGPHASAADFALGTAPNQVHSTVHANAAFSPAVLGARDQLASAIATATPEAAAITTLPPPQVAGAAIPALGGDMHALQKHAA